MDDEQLERVQRWFTNYGLYTRPWHPDPSGSREGGTVRSLDVTADGAQSPLRSQDLLRTDLRRAEPMFDVVEALVPRQTWDDLHVRYRKSCAREGNR